MKVSIPQDYLVVNGARHYAEQIKSIIRQHGKGALSYDCSAVLKHEAQNSFDVNATAVFVENLQVGYISAEKSQKVHQLLSGKETTLSCTLIWNGNPDLDYSLYTVQLFG